MHMDTTLLRGAGLPDIDPARILGGEPCPLLFATVSGAHLYGFPSRDSDVDLRGVHVLPAEDLVGLRPPEETRSRMWDHDGTEMDLVTHDLRKFVRLMLKPNGYVLEQLLSPLVVHTTPLHAELAALAPSVTTRNHAHHYRGFAGTASGCMGCLRGTERPSAHCGNPSQSSCSTGMGDSRAETSYKPTISI